MTSFNIQSTPSALIIPGTAAWFDASNPAGTRTWQANSTPLTAWQDLSGWQNSVGGGTPPTFLTNQQNGLPGISFDGATTNLVSSNSQAYMNPGLKGMTCFAVASTNSVTGYARICAATTISFLVGHNSTSYIFTTGHVKDYSSSAGAWAINTPQIMTSTYNSSTFGVSFYKNGTLYQNVSGTANGATTASTFTIGCNPLGGENWGGLIFEIILLFRVCTTTEITTINRYLADKWGIVGP